MSAGQHPLPADVDMALGRARRLEWWTIGWMISVIAVVGLAMGSSQAMRTAWIEDILSLLPPISFLVADWLESKGPSRKYPYGFARVHSLAFFGSAAALSTMGVLLLYEATMALIRTEHPTIGSVRLFGTEIWLGWLMMAALAYSVIPPVIVGRKKKPVAETLSDEVLHTDALMNAADWQTGVAGFVGVFGVALGFWWADAVAAGFIAFSILQDGIRAFAIAVAELVDGAPRKLGTREIDPAAARIVATLEARYPGASVQVRETGRYIRAVVEPKDEPDLPPDIAKELAGESDAWRLVEVAVASRKEWP